MNELSPWDAWLSRSECLPVLEKVARAVIRQAASIGLPDGLLPCEPVRRLSSQDMEECTHAVAHDLWVFLRTRPDGWKERIELQWLWERGERFVARRIAREYLLHCKDQARTFGANPWLAFYRKVRQILQEDPAIHYCANSRGAFFSLEPDSPEWIDTDDLRAVPYERWESPLHISPAAELQRKDRLRELARFFWKQAVARLGGSGCFLPVRELVHYLSRHYDCLLAVPTASSQGNPPGSQDDQDASWDQPGVESAPEHSIVRSKLQALAEQLVASWSDRHRHAFYLVHGQGLTLEATAERMGYKGASGAAYVYRSALERLRDFSLLWPGLSPPDLDENLFDDFVERILALCKTDV